LSREDIDAVFDFVLTLSGGAQKASYAKGQKVFAENCAACHGADGRGGRDVGAPNLADKIWLYGGDRASVFSSVYTAHAGVMPAWGGVLPPSTIKQLAIYVHELGGGEPEPQAASASAAEAAPVKE
jgi:cytochrome c oxidase cbb3-type subunit 3